MMAAGLTSEDILIPRPRGTYPATSKKIMRRTAVSASLGFATFQVHASHEKEAPKKEYLKLEELSLYTSPASKTTYVEDKQTPLEENISLLRHSIQPYTTWCQEVYCKAKPKVETAIEHSKGTYEFLKDAPPEFYPRLGVIGFAGLVGLFLARGSKVKKMIYPLSFTGIAASLYYPQQAVTIAKCTGSVVYDWGLQGYVALESLWKDGGKKKKSSKKMGEKAEVTSKKPSDETVTATVEMLETESCATSPP